MKNIRITSVQIAFIGIMISGIFACKYEKIPRDIFYSIPYNKSVNADINNLKISDKKGFIPLYADQLGKMPDKSDLSAEFKSSWSPDGLLINCQVMDNQVYIDTSYPS